MKYFIKENSKKNQMVKKLIKIMEFCSFWIIIQAGVLFSADPGDIVITEFFTQPAGDVYQYIEIFNTTENSINLMGWRIKIAADNNYDHTIDSLIYINPFDHIVLYGLVGQFMEMIEIDSDSTYYCGINFNWRDECDSNRADLYNFEFPDLSTSASVVINVFHGDTLIDYVEYNTTVPEWSAIIAGSGSVGRAAEFIINPTHESILDPYNDLKGDSLNNNVIYWRSSEYEHPYFYDYTYTNFGSPLETNYTDVRPTRKNKIPDVTVNEDAADTTIDISIVFTDVDNYDALITKEVESNSNSSLVSASISGNTLTLDYQADQNGTAEIIVRAHSEGTSTDSTVTDTFIVTVIPVNDAPILTEIGDKSTDEDTDKTIELSASDVDVATNGQTLTFSASSSDESLVTVSTTSGNYKGSGTLTHDVQDNQHGAANITVTLTDSEGVKDSVTFAFTVNPIADIPNISDATTNEDVMSSSGLVIRRNAVDGVEVTHVKITNITNGSLYQIDGITPILDNAFISFTQDSIALKFDPLNDFNGVGFITIQASTDITSDGLGGDTVQATITVKTINDAPEALDDIASGDEDNDISSDVSLNDSDLDSTNGDAPLEYYALHYAVNSDPSNGSVVMDDNGIYTYTPDQHWNGIDSFTYMVSDEASGSDTTTVTLIVNAINDAPIIDSLWFNNAIIQTDNYYHIAEDTVDVGFGLKFHDIDADSSLNDNAYNLDNLKWSFQGLNGATDQKVYASGDGYGFTIDSLYSNFNGETDLRVIIEDEEYLRDTIDIPIYIDQRNDSLLPFGLHPVLQDYSIDATTIDSVRDVVYFRLPQNKEKKTINEPEKLRFAWQKKDIDIDINPELNKGELFHLYYRLEAVLSDTFFIILKDNIDHGDELFANSIDSIFADINMTDEFVYYVDSYEDHPKDIKTTLDITGYTSYKWRVVAQNYQKDNLGHDPFQISSGVDSTEFRIDLIPPEVTDFNIMINKMYPSYYDALWESNGLYMTDSTFININEDSNQFAAVSLRNPRQLTDSLYHFTGILPANLTSATINYNVQLRDKAMNSGEWSDTVTYARIPSNIASSFSSPSGLVRVNIDKAGVDEPVAVFIAEEKIKIITERNVSDVYQLTSSINFSPKDIVLNNKGEISFDINGYLSPAIYDWQYVIMEINDEGYEQLNTYFNDGIVSAEIQSLSSFAVYVNLGITRPIPTAFKLDHNYPNPFNPTTIIPLEIPEESFVRASIYNILGQEVVILLEGIQSPGYKHLQWHGNNQFGKQVSSGIYFVQVHYNEKVITNKMMLLK